MSTCSWRQGHKHKHPNRHGSQTEGWPEDETEAGGEIREEKKERVRTGFEYISLIAELLRTISLQEHKMNSELSLKWEHCLLC